jgi:hypothetical protein
MSQLDFLQAQEVILTAESVAINSESSDQEISLFRAFFDSVVNILPEDKFVDLAESLATIVADEIANKPYEMQLEYVEKLKKLMASE